MTTHSPAETSDRTALAVARDQLAMMQLLLQALTNNCPCIPCQGLRSMAQQLALLTTETAPPDGSPQVNHGPGPQQPNSAHARTGE